MKKLGFQVYYTEEGKRPATSIGNVFGNNAEDYRSLIAGACGSSVADYAYFLSFFADHFVLTVWKPLPYRNGDNVTVMAFIPKGVVLAPQEWKELLEKMKATAELDEESFKSKKNDPTSDLAQFFAKEYKEVDVKWGESYNGEKVGVYCWKSGFKLIDVLSKGSSLQPIFSDYQYIFIAAESDRAKFKCEEIKGELKTWKRVVAPKIEDEILAKYYHLEFEGKNPNDVALFVDKEDKAKWIGKDGYRNVDCKVKADGNAESLDPSKVERDLGKVKVNFPQANKNESLSGLVKYSDLEKFNDFSKKLPQGFSIKESDKTYDLRDTTSVSVDVEKFKDEYFIKDKGGKTYKCDKHVMFDGFKWDDVPNQSSKTTTHFYVQKSSKQDALTDGESGENAKKDGVNKTKQIIIASVVGVLLLIAGYALGCFFPLFGGDKGETVVVQDKPAQLTASEVFKKYQISGSYSLNIESQHDALRGLYYALKAFDLNKLRSFQNGVLSDSPQFKEFVIDPLVKAEKAACLDSLKYLEITKIDRTTNQEVIHIGTYKKKIEEKVKDIEEKAKAKPQSDNSSASSAIPAQNDKGGKNNSASGTKKAEPKDNQGNDD